MKTNIDNVGSWLGSRLIFSLSVVGIFYSFRRYSVIFFALCSYSVNPIHTLDYWWSFKQALIIRKPIIQNFRKFHDSVFLAEGSLLTFPLSQWLDKISQFMSFFSSSVIKTLFCSGLSFNLWPESKQKATSSCKTCNVIIWNNALEVILTLSKTETISFEFNHEISLFYFYRARVFVCKSHSHRLCNETKW